MTTTRAPAAADPRRRWSIRRRRSPGPHLPRRPMMRGRGHERARRRRPRSFGASAQPPARPARARARARARRDRAALVAVSLSVSGPKVLAAAPTSSSRGSSAAAAREPDPRSGGRRAARVRQRSRRRDGRCDGRPARPWHRFRRARARPELVLAALLRRVAVRRGCRATCSTTSSQRTVKRLRADVEAKLMRVPLSYFDGQPHGEILSPRHQRHRQRRRWRLQQTLTQILNAMLIGRRRADHALRDLAAARARSRSSPCRVASVLTARIGKRAQKSFVAQWKHVGALNGQIEEAFTGHALVKVFGRRAEVESPLPGQERGALRCRFRAQFVSSIDHAGDQLHREPQLRRDRGDRRAARRGGRDARSAASRRSSSTRASSPSQLSQLASVANVAAVRRRLGRARLRAARHPGPVGRSRRRRPLPAIGARRGPVRGRLVPLQARRAADRAPVAGRPPRADRRDRRPDRRRQDHAGQPADALLRPRRRPDPARRHRHRGGAARASCARGSAWCCRTPGCSAGRSATTSGTASPSATEDELLAAAKATYVDRFVRALPDGYDTVIDEESSNLSVGEKQLITIARAFLADPAILILDEATSSVDTRTEVLVQHAMATLRARPHQLRDRAPAVDDPRCRRHPGHGARHDRRAGHPRRAARRRRPLPRRCTTPSSPPRRRRSLRGRATRASRPPRLGSRAR